MIKLHAWNVNGLRAILKKNFHAYLAAERPDILCLQETKISEDLVTNFQFEDYPYVYWNCAEKKGYSGTAILSRQEPRFVRYGIGIEQHDREGRVVTAEFDDYHVVTVYTPNSQNHDENKRPKRLDYRTKAWDVDFLAYVQALDAKKPVIFCGDLNVAHHEIDLANPTNNRKNAGFTDEERTGFDRLLAAGFADSFRHFHPTARDCYTWWTYRGGARQRNVGWRIDYVCLASRLLPRLKDARILHEVAGSDHCPVEILLAT